MGISRKSCLRLSKVTLDRLAKERIPIGHSPKQGGFIFCRRPRAIFDIYIFILFNTLMAEIATYRCSDRQCGFVLRLSRDFPLWKEHTPPQLKSPANAVSAKEYVLRYRSESFCKVCRSVVEYSDAYGCFNCNAEVPREHAAQECPRCTDGTLSMPHLLVY